MGIDFIGTSILEIITDDKLSALVVTTTRLMGITVDEDFEVLAFTVRSRRPGESGAERTKRNLDTVIYRLQKNVANAKNQWAGK